MEKSTIPATEADGTKDEHKEPEYIVEHKQKE